MDMNNLLDLSSLHSSLFPEPSKPPPPIPGAPGAAVALDGGATATAEGSLRPGAPDASDWSVFQSAPPAAPASNDGASAPTPLSDATASHPLLFPPPGASPSQDTGPPHSFSSGPMGPPQGQPPPLPSAPGGLPEPQARLGSAVGSGTAPIPELRRPGSAVQRRPVSSDDVPSSLAGLQALARRGSWRAVLDRARAGRQSAGTPEEQLAYATLHVLALMKLRMYGAAADELRDVGDLSAAHLRYEAHPREFPGRTGSMVPFGLWWLSAELSHRMGRSAEALDQLYHLLSRCDVRLRALEEELRQPEAAAAGEPSDAQQDAREQEGAGNELPAGGPPEQPTHTQLLLCDDLDGLDRPPRGGGTSPALELWARRRELVQFTALGHHVAGRNFLAALQLCRVLVRRRPRDPLLLSKLGYTQLQMGDVEGARAAFERVEAVAAGEGEGGGGHLAALVRRNRGLLLFALKQYSAALPEFDAVLEADPTDGAAHNNKALCLMYARDLVGAIRVLEEALQPQRCPLNETLVRNLCSMYELASTSSTTTKKNLSNWLMRLAPDDFDLTCTRL